MCSGWPQGSLVSVPDDTWNPMDQWGWCPILRSSVFCIYIYIYIYGGCLKWWYPTMGFPTKNDHFEVWNGGYHHLRKHPYEAHHAFLESRAAAFVADAFVERCLGKMCGSLFSWPWFVRFVEHSTGIQRFGQLLCQVRCFGTSWYNSKDNGVKVQI